VESLNGPDQAGGGAKGSRSVNREGDFMSHLDPDLGSIASTFGCTTLW
jgi:hypothetical protein